MIDGRGFLCFILFLFGFFRVGSAPFGDFAVVAGKEDVRDGHAAKIVRLSVLGVFQVVAVGKGFDDSGLFTAEDAGDEASDAINNSEGRKLTAGEDVVTQGNFVVHDA